ncbi:MAG: peptidoglycan DD-metalloendopeptidase family protein [Betaproteobacteria bacterium]
MTAQPDHELPINQPPPLRSATFSHRLLRHGVVALLAVLMVACASRTRAPVDDRTGSPAPVALAGAVTAPLPSAPMSPDGESRTPTYTVKRGDTLFQIALDYGLDYKELAAWNNLENLNLIRVGQVLRVTSPGDTAAAAPGVITSPLRTPAPVTAAVPGAAVVPAPSSSAGSSAGSSVGTSLGPSAGSPAATAARNADNYKSAPKAIKEPYSEHAMREVARAAQASPETVATAVPAIVPKSETPRTGASGNAADQDDEDKLEWVWPAKGKVVVTFSETANLKGIDIAGATGDPVIATAAGKVVYVGNGLRGYGKLVIVKHNKTWLSAYAHNREILVKEGQQVTRGQKIAEMGNTDADQVKLHFEIRRLGKPVDPARYLPAG